MTKEERILVYRRRNISGEICLYRDIDLNN